MTAVNSELAEANGYHDKSLPRLSSAALLTKSDGCILSANSAAVEFFSVRADQLAGRIVFDLMSEASAAELRPCLLADSCKPGTLVSEYRISLQNTERGGTAVIVHVAGQSGEPQELCLWLISQGTHAANRAIEAQSHIALLQSIQAVNLEDTAALVAHEFSQPLAAIVAYAEGTVRRLTSTTPLESVKSTVQRIAGLARRACETVDHLRSSVSAHDGPRYPCDLNDAVKSVIHLLNVKMNDSAILLDFSFSAAPVITANPAEIGELLFNVITNSIEAMQATTSAKRLGIHTRTTTGNEVELVITDTGCGIPAEHLTLVGKPFFTTKRGHLGLGLAICRRIVDRHGGELTLESDGSTGAAVTVQFARD